MKVLNGENKLKKKYPFLCLTNGGGTLELARSKRLTNELQVPVSLNSPLSIRRVLSHCVYTDW